MQSKLLGSPNAIIFLLSGILFLGVTVSVLVVGNSILVAPVVSALFIALGGAAAVYRPAIASSGAAAALIGQAIAFTTAFAGHPWQLDTHMLFFALLACLVILRSVPAILVATAITAVHHLSLTFAMPALVYPTGAGLVENLGRTVMHAVIVLVETAALVYAVLRLTAMERGMADQNATLEQSLAQAKAASEEAKAAQAQALELQREAEASTDEVKKLLGEAEQAAQQREVANAERDLMREEQARQQEEKAAEQTSVVDALRAGLNALQKGDLTTRIRAAMPEGYEGLRASFNSAVETLETMVAEVSHQTQNIEGEIQEVASAAKDLAVRTERQAMTLRQATQDLEGLTKQTHEAASAVNDANTSAVRAQSNATQSEKIVGEASNAMQAIQAESVEISNIVKVIDDISFQTNLLALNAGVEAARAGEAGRGFSVVASEVRALAQRSSDSAKGIRELIERSGHEVENGTKKISETVTSLQEILAAIFEITGQTEQVAASSAEQRNDVQTLNARLCDLDETTRHNTAMFEETSAACASLLQSASALRALTQKFQVSSETTPAERAA